MGTEGEEKRREVLWQPITFEYLLDRHTLGSKRVVAMLLFWVVMIGASLALTLQLMPSDWASLASSGTDILHYFLFNPALILGTLLFFWLGFEWGFTPVFLSSFVIAFHSGMHWSWALVFGIAFVLGMAICAMAYQGFQVSYRLRSIKSLFFYVAIMFIGSIASSLGAFIWSFAHHLSAYNTLVIWKSWWSGTFLQAILIVGPLLFLATPLVERAKDRWLGVPNRKKVSMKWVFGAVTSITGALALFIYSGKILGKLRVEEVMKTNEMATVADVIGGLESFELISWISIGIIVVTGFGAFNLISSWNRQLGREVANRTRELDENREKLKKSLADKKILLKEIHHRVKNNMALMGALLELQQKMGGGQSSEKTLQTARSRIRSMAMAHEALYRNETFSDISMREYIRRIATYTHNSFTHPDTRIDLQFQLDDARLEMSKSIPLGLLVNEILINSFKHAFEGRQEGIIRMESRIENGEVELSISDDGVGLPQNGEAEASASLGTTLIRRFSKQLKGELSIDSEKGGGTGYTLRFEV